ncbi:MAG TPA: ChaN family lipoprotein [Casimicrobiaceae bacterium]|nr:ChaN family lipoprotein [Casimicrobiaceae bacterium]
MGALSAMGALLALLAACTLPARPHGSDLVGRIWDVAARRFVDEPALVEALAAVRYPLLGERHDNPAHHVLRARLITALAARGSHAAVVLEPFDLEHDGALQAAQQAGGDAERLADAGRLDRKAWAWPLHKPIVEAALQASLPVRAGNLSRDTLRANLAAALDDPQTAWAARLRRSPWTDAQARTLEADIVEGHCGTLPATAVARIALAQRARDAAMAQALVDAATASGAVLIAGNGHVRADVGVPAYLHAPAAAGARGLSISVGFVEVPREAERDADPHALAARQRGFDYVWFTAEVEREDPCARMKSAPGPAGAAGRR